MTAFDSLIPAVQNFNRLDGRCDLRSGITVTAPACLKDAVSRCLSRNRIDNGPTPLHISLAAEGTALPGPDMDESYTLEITPKHIRIEAAERWGAYHALEVLNALIAKAEAPCGTVTDAPRHPWRGLKLDCVRHKINFDTVLDVVDAMAAARLNVLHIGLTNNQGWRVESHTYPRLHETASDGHYYTQNQMHELVAFAAARGIRVVPEINMPGHSTAILLAYPELAAGNAPTKLATGYGVIADEMHPFKPAVFTFAERIVGEMANLFPDPYFHFGGDEVTGKNWQDDQTVQAEAKKRGLNSKAEIQASFTARLAEIIRAHGKRPVAWEEVVNGAPSANDLLIENWMNSAGHPSLAPYTQISANGYYLDHFLPAAVHWHHPIGTGVLGGEGCAWAEAMNTDTIFGHIFPRMAALAEVFWCGGPAAQPLAPRLAHFDTALLKRGLDSAAGQSTVLNRYIAGKADAGAVTTLAGLLSPVAYYLLLERGGEQEADISTPFNRFVQALRADPPLARAFSRSVEYYLATGKGRGGIEAAFAMWAALPAQLAGRPDLAPLAATMAELAEYGRSVLAACPASLPPAAYAPITDPTFSGIFNALGTRLHAEGDLLSRQVVFDVVPALQQLAQGAS